MTHIDWEFMPLADAALYCDVVGCDKAATNIGFCGDSAEDDENRVYESVSFACEDHAKAFYLAIGVIAAEQEVLL